MTLRDEFLLAPGLAFLNHASYGATPRSIFERRREYQLELEANPLPALTADYWPRLDGARDALASHVGADPTDIVWMPNTTFGMNLIARSLASELRAGDEVLLTDHEYGSVIHLWDWLCAAREARMVLQPLPVPLAGRAEAILAGVSRRTRIIVVSHVTSDTAAVLPVAEICREARRLGITTVVDGAHVVGQVPFRLASLPCDYYVGDLHKWACAPRPTGFLFAAPGAQQRLEFHARRLAPAVADARAMLADLDAPLAALGCRPVTETLEQDLLMRSWILPATARAAGLTERLRSRHQVELQVVPDARWGALIRVSVAWYSEPDEGARLLDALRVEL